MPETQYIIAEDGRIAHTWHLYEVKPIGTISSSGGKGYLIKGDEKKVPWMSRMSAAKEILKRKDIRALPSPGIRTSVFKWFCKSYG